MPQSALFGFLQYSLRVLFTVVYFLLMLFLTPILLLLCSIPIFPTRTLRKNVQERLGKSQSQSLWFCFLVYSNYVKYFLESFFLLPLNSVQCVNLKEVSERLKHFYNSSGCAEKQRAFVLLSAHFGHIESLGKLVSQALEEQNIAPMTVLAQPSKFFLVNIFLNAYRKLCGLNVLLTKGNELVRCLVSSCKAGKTLGLLVDQKPKKSGVFLPFFGKHAAFPNAGLRLCLNENLTPVYVVGERLSLGCFYIHVQLGVNLQNTNQSEKVTAELESYAKWLEHRIWQSPHQWFWDYKKWSREQKPI